MDTSFKSYIDLVEQSYQGYYQLPRFQRPYRWGPSNIMALFDSLRKEYPIGSMLFCSSKTTSLSYQPLEFTKPEQENPEQLILDGQQRLTAGLCLFFGTHPNKFFIDLKQLKTLIELHEIDIQDEEAVRSFAYEIDDTDDYMYSKKISKVMTSNSISKFLRDSELLYTGSLIDQNKLYQQHRAYFTQSGEEELMYNVIGKYFALSGSNPIPVVALGKEDSLTALTRIFTTTNTTGKDLTPMEIVYAVLIGQNLDLKELLDELREISDYCEMVDPDGSVLLQTIALIAGKTPKKSLLPKTITAEMFHKYSKEAIEAIDRASMFLTEQFALALNEGKKLLPYDSIIAPMAFAFHKLKLKPRRIKDADKKKLLRWFIGSALSQRYQEGVHNKQSNDATNMAEWLQGGKAPSWVTETTIPLTIKSASPAGALGKIVKCFINNQKPIDPLTKIPVGFYPKSKEGWSEHSLWPKSECEGMKRWRKNNDKHNIIMNKIMVSSLTNREWNQTIPWAKGEKLIGKNEIFGKQLMSEKNVKILSKKEMSKKDFDLFINERLRLLIKEIKKYGFKMGEQEVFDYEN